jgi:phosphoribosylanthranilate isomerase
MVKVKICGITNIEDAMAAIGFGADALGFIFFGKSPRHISPDEAKGIIRQLPVFTATVGVFVDMEKDNVQAIMDHAGLDIAQFHGKEPPEACNIGKKAVKAIHISGPDDVEAMKHYDVSAYLLDTHVPDAPGGTGRVFDWDIALEAKRFGRIILAGGLTHGNVGEAVKHVLPYAVDACSGVEAEKGVKDHRKLELFIKRAKAAG